MQRIALVGDRNDAVVAHRAIPIALGMAVDALQVDVSWEWLPTRTITGDTRRILDRYDAVWCVPGSPYESTDGALAAIRFARETRRPFLGTCGGFQHALLEYAQSIWGIDAVHAESNANANGDNPVIAPLMCALVDVKGALHFPPGSRLAAIYGSATATEEYHCSFGLNPIYVERFKSGPLKIAARDDEGSVRAVELHDHPFYIGTLFQPERAALRDRLPPLVKAFMAATARGRD
jgi:CTP synthase (UTP-ammonia lyase)